jgi:hypothetical protein
MLDSLQLAAHVDSAVALAMSRVIMKTLRAASPEIAKVLDATLLEEVERLKSDAKLYDDPVAEAAAVIMHQTYVGRDSASA